MARFIHLKTLKIEETPACPHGCGHFGGINKTLTVDFKEYILSTLRFAPQGADREKQEIAGEIIRKVRAAQPGEWLELDTAEFKLIDEWIQAKGGYRIVDDVLLEFMNAIHEPAKLLPDGVAAARASSAGQAGESGPGSQRVPD
jgi:hypothetical protein